VIQSAMVDQLAAGKRVDSDDLPKLARIEASPLSKIPGTAVYAFGASVSRYMLIGISNFYDLFLILSSKDWRLCWLPEITPDLTLSICLLPAALILSSIAVTFMASRDPQC
jgi:hypothetical protein